ncbi:MAG: hypothetical protein KIH01_03640 [Candidatus Freyarchaeota archaeon]|nr:hypothetical protein [Candidatus Jordarchaeia archaeon]
MLDGVCLAVADEIRGPICVHSIGLSHKLADRATMKALIGTISVGTCLSEEEISIVPLQDEGKSIFSYVFPYKDRTARGGVRILSIVLVTDKRNTAFLYRFAPALYDKVRKVAEEIKRYYKPPLQFEDEGLRKLNELMEIDVSMVTPLKLKEYLIQFYLSRSDEKRRDLLARTASIARGITLSGEKVDLVGLGKDRKPLWVLLTTNIVTGGPEKLIECYKTVKELKEKNPWVEAFFLLDELRYSDRMILPDIELDRTENVWVLQDCDGRVRLIGLWEGKLLWLFTPVKLITSPEEQEEERKRIYEKRMENPDIEAVFVLCEIFSDTEIKIPEEVPEPGVRVTLIKRKIGLREKYKKIIEKLRGED